MNKNQDIGGICMIFEKYVKKNVALDASTLVSKYHT